MYLLTKELFFPEPESSERHGLVALGGDLSTERLLLAYKKGIFPWFSDDEPILWWSPLQRMILFFDELKISKSMRQVIRNGNYRVTFNTAFKEVISNCQKMPRSGQDGTWITSDMEEAYVELHRLGYAKSVEVWEDDELIGGLYGIDMNPIFCGESMFSKRSNASKIAFFALAAHLQSQNYSLLDCQVYNDHLASLGCREIPRNEFLKLLRNN